MGRKRKWWLIPVLIVLLLTIFTAAFWNTIIIYLAPKAVLTTVLTNTASSLETRFASGPLSVLTQGIDFQGKNTIELQLDTQNELLGEVRYEMNIQMEQRPRRVLAQGQAIYQGSALDMSVYLDGNFMAVSSADLLHGNFYGLTYESFAQDIRSNTLLRLLLSEDIIQQWEAQITNLQQTMNQSIDIPDLSQMDYKSLILGIMAMDVEVSRELLTVGEEDANCFALSFDATGAQLLEGMNYLNIELPISIEPESDLELTFFLYKDALVKFTVELDSDSSDSDLSVVLGVDPAKDDIRILLRNPEGFREISLQSAYDETVYYENIAISQSQNNVSSESLISYRWNRSSGDMQLSVTQDQELTSVSLNLQKGESGFIAKTGDFEGLMRILTGAEDTGNSACSMTVTKGSMITVPKYKNFDQWSMEDLITLLSGIGSLFGLKIA